PVRQQRQFVVHQEPRRRHDPERRLTARQDGSRPTARGLRTAPAGGMLSFMSDVTRILSAIEQGDPSAADQLLPLVYDELRRLAAVQMGREKPGQTLDARRWCMRPICGWWASSNSPTGVTSFARPRRRCAASWCKM